MAAHSLFVGWASLRPMAIHRIGGARRSLAAPPQLVLGSIFEWRADAHAGSHIAHHLALAERHRDRRRGGAVRVIGMQKVPRLNLQRAALPREVPAAAVRAAAAALGDSARLDHHARGARRDLDSRPTGAVNDTAADKAAGTGAHTHSVRELWLVEDAHFVLVRDLLRVAVMRRGQPHHAVLEPEPSSPVHPEIARA
eukprot:scaffold6959_cov146-Isochrysis_galbana.AAC.3